VLIELFYLVGCLAIKPICPAKAKTWARFSKWSRLMTVDVYGHLIPEATAVPLINLIPRNHPQPAKTERP
jgi:hypothetical protein